jgi:hypothetical protein
MMYVRDRFRLRQRGFSILIASFLPGRAKKKRQKNVKYHAAAGYRMIAPSSIDRLKERADGAIGSQ